MPVGDAVYTTRGPFARREGDMPPELSIGDFRRLPGSGIHC